MVKGSWWGELMGGRKWSSDRSRIGIMVRCSRRPVGGYGMVEVV